MKCIKVIKEAKSYTLGEVRRVADVEADERVKTGIWKFVPKSEWKVSKKGKKEEVEISHDMGGSVEVKKEKKKKVS
jgi:hypothetical protein